ncbi:hypothetical protein BJ912DRAFT_1070076 [Pholiota molesta]|nr:hypothetical protein BJ912DRAFT_1070076 [Pholiota molesta]
MNRKKTYQPARRQGKCNPLLQTDVDAANGFTYDTVSKKLKNGKMKEIKVKVPLDRRLAELGAGEGAGTSNTPQPSTTYNPLASSVQNTAADMYFDHLNDSETVSDTGKASRPRKTERTYVQEYVDRVDEFLQASLSREALPSAQIMCSSCTDNHWRFGDVSMQPIATSLSPVYAVSACRQSIPCHPKMDGNIFCRAELWEKFLEKFQHPKDMAEQEYLRNAVPATATGHGSSDSTEDPDWIMGDNTEAKEMPTDHPSTEPSGDEEFLAYLDKLRAGIPATDDTPIDAADDAAIPEADTEVTRIPAYLEVRGHSSGATGEQGPMETDSPGPLPLPREHPTAT